MEILKKIVVILKPFKNVFLFVFLSSAVIEMFGIISPYFYGKIVNAALISKSFEQAMMFVLLNGGMLALGVLLGQIKNRYENKNFDWAVKQYLSVEGLTKALSFSLGQHKNEHSGIKLSVLSNGANALSSTAYMLSYEFLGSALNVVFAIIAISFISLTIGLVSTAGVVILIVWILHTNGKFKDKMVQERKMWDENSRVRHEIVENIEVVKTNAQEKRVISEFKNNSDEAQVFAQNLWIRFSDESMLRNIFSLMIYVLCMALAIVFFFNGSLAGGFIVTLFFWLSWVFNGIGRLGRMHRRLMQDWAAIRRLFIMFDVESDIKNSPNAMCPKIIGAIEFRHVSFAYPKQKFISDEDSENKNINEEIGKEESKEVLSDISFSIKSGERIALVGESGAGKSTTASLMLRAYDPTKGEILIDGKNLKDIEIDYYRDHVGFVEQSVMLFDNTLRYNILFPLNGKSKDFPEDELRRISKTARIDKFITRMPKEYDTTIGERGVRLSGGERQRISIARALVKNPKILIFDEATSNLDSTNEKEIREALYLVSKGRTVIIIAHRLSTIKDADRIFMFHEGKIIGVGKHTELLRTCPEYGRLVNDQILA